MKKFIKFLANPWFNFWLVLFLFLSLAVLAWMLAFEGYVFDGVSLFFGGAFLYLALWFSDVLGHLFFEVKSSASADDDKQFMCVGVCMCYE